jgi:hypothetical protein
MGSFAICGCSFGGLDDVHGLIINDFARLAFHRIFVADRI